MSFNKILKELKLENVFMKKPVKQKVFNHIKNSVPLVKGCNYQADLLFLPETKNNNKYLLVVVDLADNSFDIEELKNKDAKTVLEAFKQMFKRGYIKEPEISIRTDSGTEFQKEFDKYLNEKEIFHSVGLPNRHKQLSNVENLNKELGKVFNSYMNKKEEETGEQYNNWDDITSIVREKGNKIRTINLPKYSEYKIKMFDPIKAGEAKFKFGEMVYRALDAPKNALGHDQTTKNFRVGDIRWDTLPRKIIKVLYYPDFPYYRYMLHGIKQASYSENELMKVSTETDKEQKFEIEKFCGFRTQNKIEQVLIKWKGYKVKDNTWEPVENIKKEMGLKVYNLYVDKYNAEYKQHKQKDTIQEKPVLNTNELRRSARLNKA